ncbi:PCP degradation transcriptional activation protein [invertebrate metagenome]|uniref:PCP degradation transcriptional activation protein n=1 Tax=invertebrate metagenome TaxID=1711999 RepID=A0A2H9T7U1_9ZZZZ
MNTINLARIDLNLMVYFDTLLRERNVSRAAQIMGITQPAMSNGLRRLRQLLDDPVLVRTRSGMVPTDRALAIYPEISQALQSLGKSIQPVVPFDYSNSDRVFRIMTSDYAEATLIPALLRQLRLTAPDITLDVLTPSDVTFQDIEQGRVDMAINRFKTIPDSFHQKILWRDGFSCIVSKSNPILEEFTLENYLSAQHIWVSKTGIGTSAGIDPDKSQHFSWVDEALARMGHRRNIRLFTRHYQIAALLSGQNDLLATLPSRLAFLQKGDTSLVVLAPPFSIPDIDLTMVWSPLLHNDLPHRWFRRLITKVAQSFVK